MSLRIIKPGILDTVQDGGRHGYRHLGINPGGAMDSFSAGLANALLGKEGGAAVIEMHFPAPHIVFEAPTMICMTGADFSPELDNIPIPLNQPVIINKNTLLTFTKRVWGACCYLAILHTFSIEKWLNSYSTHLKAKAGGFRGRALQKGDVIPFVEYYDFSDLLGEKPFCVLPWKVPVPERKRSVIQFIKGAEWDLLTREAKALFGKELFTMAPQSDRMGYRLQGKPLKTSTKEQLISTPVAFGTVQLLPNGQTILLMADHQTTGGYPKIAQVASVHLPLLAQMQPGATFSFSEVNLQTAERELWQQKHYLQQVKSASQFKIEKLLHANL